MKAKIGLEFRYIFGVSTALRFDWSDFKNK